MNRKVGWVRIKNHPQGHKYQLTRAYSFVTEGYSEINLHTAHITLLARSGLLIVDRGFSWDGASGPTIDDSSNIRASLAHDALYLLLREGLLGWYDSPQWKRNRKKADQLFYQLLREDGMNWFRAKYYYLGVRLFGGKHAKA